jgi:hypothetical protein
MNVKINVKINFVSKYLSSQMPINKKISIVPES